ncbi:MAG: gamma carbonic anhydrase family protein [Gammaproteobacteria bacterium]|nr:gamma carbonic anhydrase family protein [Gammaproteobacteria bacterium]
MIRKYKDISPALGSRVYVDEQACVIGDVVLGDDCSIWPMAVLRGDVNSIRVGARTNIQDGSVVHVTHRFSSLPEGHAVSIGNDVTIGHNVTVHGCSIGDECLIGIGSTILDGAVIHKHVLLGAGSLVTEGKELHGGYLWLGRPAKKVRELTEDEIKWFTYSANHYRKLKDDYLA